jgi:hypothetical protein
MRAFGIDYQAFGLCGGVRFAPCRRRAINRVLLAQFWGIRLPQELARTRGLTSLLSQEPLLSHTSEVSGNARK